MGLQGVKTVFRPPSFENWDEEPKIFRKPEVSSLFLIKLV